MYPFATQNKKDFYNLLDVYLDAAFFPNLDKLSFKQEGYRIELEKSGELTELVYKGIVYNEMKGAMSSPDEILVRSILGALCPSNTYKYNSGGDPEDIPKLTYAQFKDFHKRFYHPSNAFFYTYGSLDLQEYLEFIDNKILQSFDRIDPKTNIEPQTRWNSPKTVIKKYPIAENEDLEKKSQIALAWLTSENENTFETLSLAMLSHILLGNSAAPLRKALIDSALGSSLCDGTGFDNHYKDTIFICGLKVTKESDDLEIEKIIFNTIIIAIINLSPPFLLK